MPLPRRSLLLLPAALAACTSVRPEIRSDYDHDADFSRFRTFGWAHPFGTDGAGYETFTTERLRAAVREQMDLRGYTFTEEHPDLLVNLHIHPARRSTREVFVHHPLDPWGYYAYRFYEPWPGWGFGSEEVVSRYTPGTLSVDLVDRAKNRLVWEGVATGDIASGDRDNRAGRIDRTVAAIFERYPFMAGGGRPQR